MEVFPPRVGWKFRVFFWSMVFAVPLGMFVQWLR
jgi:hypothetical protein